MAQQKTWKEQSKASVQQPGIKQKEENKDQGYRCGDLMKELIFVRRLIIRFGEIM